MTAFDPELRGVRLRASAPAALQRALDWLHVHADVRGVLEQAGGDACEVWLRGPLPDLSACGTDVEVEPVACTRELFAHTGRERDRALLVAPDLCVRPPWTEPPAGFAGVDLVVPRGSAFGSGEHGSTRAALRVLHAIWPAGGVATAIDVGTGSGVLAAYAAARGAGAVVACDVERAAASACHALLPRARVVCGGPEALAVTGDVVVANLTAAELAACRRELLRLTRRGGLLVVSGLRPGDEELRFAAATCAAPLCRIEDGGFVGLALRPPAPG